MALPSGPLVSVVTPVHNGERYLAACIESILGQTYPHWEYVIVNNVSSDRSLELARAYAERDGRVRVSDNAQLLPAVDNWNHALRQLSPESRYCKVVHADDWLFPDCLTQMVALAEAHPRVGLVSAYRLEEDTVSLDGLPYGSSCLAGREIARRSLLTGRDNACLDILQQWDFGFVHQVLTFTRRHNESRTTETVGVGARRLARLRRLLAYGPHYLEAGEYQARLRQMVAHHYRVLAHHLFELHDGAFWRYQASEMARMGLPLSWPRLAAAAAVELTDLRQAIRHVRLGLARRHRGRPPSRGDLQASRQQEPTRP
jgi:glycosyltransferase involved in cell wall biosynthesis